MSCQLRNSSGEPKPFYQSGGDIHNTYKKALEASNPGEVIKVGIFNTEDVRVANGEAELHNSPNDVVIYGDKIKAKESVFNVVLEVPISFDKTSAVGITNTLIKDGLIEESIVLEGDNMVITPEGTSRVEMSVNSIDVKEELRANSEPHGYFKRGDSYVLTPTYGKIQVGDAYYTEAEIARKVEEDDLGDVLEPDLLRRRQMLIEESLGKPELPKTVGYTNETLVSELIQFLSRIGVSIESISSYKKKYAIKHGIEPDAVALADIANQVIAFKDGKITLEELLEETAHFIVEGWNQAEIGELLPQVENTKEWAEHSEAYFKIYSKVYGEGKVREVVRREILGKFLANSLKNSSNVTEETRGLYSRIIDLLRNFFNRISRNTNEKSGAQLQEFSNKIGVLLRNKQLQANIDTGNFSKSFTTPMYAISESSKFYPIYNSATRAIVAIEKELNILQELSSTPSILKGGLTESKSRLESLDREFDNLTDEQREHKLIQSISGIYGIFDTKVKEIERFASAGLRPSPQDMQAYQILKTQLLPVIQDITSGINKDYFKKEENRTLPLKKLEALRRLAIDSLQSYTEVSVTFEGLESLDTDKQFLEDVERRSGKEARDKMEAVMEQEGKDISWFFKFFGQTILATNPYLKQLGKLIFDMTRKVTTNFINTSDPYMAKLNKYAKTLPSFIKGKYLWAHRDYTKLDENRRKIQAEVLKRNLGLSESLEELLKSDWNETTITEYIKENKLPFDPTEAVYKWRMESRYEILKSTVTGKSSNKAKAQLRRAELFKRLNISPKTYQILSNISADYARNMGITERPFAHSKFASSKDVTSITRKTYKSPYAEGEFIFEDSNFNSGLKVGLTLSSDIDSYDPTDSNQVMFGRDRVLKIDRSIATEEAIISFEINKLDADSNDRRILSERALAKNPSADISIYEYRQEGGKLVDTTRTVRAGEILEFSDDLQGVYENGVRAGVDQETLKLALFDTTVELMNFEFTEEFWNSVNENVDYNTQVEALIPRMERGDEVRESLNKIRDLTIRRNTIVRRYASTADRLEILGNELTTIDQTNIDTLSSMIREEHRNIRNILREEELQIDITKTELFEVEPNQSFFRSIKTKGDFKSLTLQEKEAYVFSLISEDQRQEYKKYKNAVARYAKGEIELQDRYQEIYDKFRGNNTHTNFEDGEFVGYLLTMLPPYFTRMAPVGYNNLIQELKDRYSRDINEGLSFTEDILNSEPYVLEAFPILRDGITINYNREEVGFEYEQDPDMFKVELEAAKEFEDRGTRLAATYSAFLHIAGVDDYSLSEDSLDKSFLEKFGVRVANTGALTPVTKNLDEFEALVNILELRAKSLENFGLLGKVNVFTYALIPRSNTERLKIDPKAGAEYMIRDLVQYREDEEEAFMRSESRRIPRIGFTNMELEDASKDLYKIAFIDLYNSEVYKQRKDTLESALSIQESLSRSAIKGKAVKDSEIWAMFNNNIDNHIYGRQTSWNKEVDILGKKVDIAKVLQTFRKFVQTHALGFSVPVALTSMTTAMINKSIQRFVNYHLYDKASNRANVEFMNLMRGSASDVGKIYTDSKLEKIMQMFGNYEATERLHNAAFGYTSRNVLNVNKLAFSVHQLGNFPVIPRVVLSKLMEYRAINGKFISWSNFLTAEQTKNPSKKLNEIKSDFDSYKKQSLYDYLLLEGGQTFDIEKLAEAGILKNAEGAPMTNVEIGEYLDKVYIDVSADISYNITQYDGIIDASQKTEAQRHPIFSFVSMFKSWLSVAATRMFAGESYNVQTGNWEQGVFRTIGASLNEVLEDVRTNKENPFTAARKIYANMTPAQRANLRSLSFSVSAIGMLVMMVTLLVSMADSGDEDDDYVLQLAAFIATRTLNETFSSTIGVPNEMIGLLENPVSSSSTIKSAVDLLSISSIGHTVKRGNYEGWNKYTANLMKMTFFKNLYAITSADAIKSARVGYTHFQQETSFHPLVLTEYLNKVGED